MRNVSSIAKTALVYPSFRRPVSPRKSFPVVQSRDSSLSTLDQNSLSPLAKPLERVWNGKPPLDPLLGHSFDHIEISESGGRIRWEEEAQARACSPCPEKRRPLGNKSIGNSQSEPAPTIVSPEGRGRSPWQAGSIEDGPSREIW